MVKNLPLWKENWRENEVVGKLGLGLTFLRWWYNEYSNEFNSLKALDLFYPEMCYEIMNFVIIVMILEELFCND